MLFPVVNFFKCVVTGVLYVADIDKTFIFMHTQSRYYIIDDRCEPTDFLLFRIIQFPLCVRQFISIIKVIYQ